MPFVFRLIGRIVRFMLICGVGVILAWAGIRNPEPPQPTFWEIVQTAPVWGMGVIIMSVECWLFWKWIRTQQSSSPR